MKCSLSILQNNSSARIMGNTVWHKIGATLFVTSRSTLRRHVSDRNLTTSSTPLWHAAWNAVLPSCTAHRYTQLIVQNMQYLAKSGVMHFRPDPLHLGRYHHIWLSGNGLHRVPQIGLQHAAPSRHSTHRHSVSQMHQF